VCDVNTVFSRYREVPSIERRMYDNSWYNAVERSFHFHITLFAGVSLLSTHHGAESSFAQRISPQSTAGECLPLKDATNSTVDLTNASPKAAESNTQVNNVSEQDLLSRTWTAEAARSQKQAESNTQVNKESEQELLTKVARTWTAGKSTRQTPECKAAVKRARERGLAPSKIAKYVVLQLNQRNQPSTGEEQRVKFSAYNVNKELKKEKEKNQPAPKTAKERVKSSPASTDLSLDKAKPGAPTNLVDLMSVGIPYQRNGAVYLQGDNSNNKRKASALEQEFVRETKKQMSVECMNQERHWVAMWKEASAELKKLRNELKDETDAQVLDELKSDIECLKKKKDKWAMLLGMNKLQ